MSNLRCEGARLENSIYIKCVGNRSSSFSPGVWQLMTAGWQVEQNQFNSIKVKASQQN